MVTWLVFDLGEVVLRPTGAIPDLATLLDAPLERLQTAYWARRREYDRASDAQSYWSAVADDAGVRSPTAEVVAQLVRVDDTGWSVADEDVLTLVDDAARAGIGLAVLSNAPSSMGRLIAAEPWSKVFEHLMFSGDLQMLKPEERIYRHLLDLLGAEPSEVAFLDDRLENVVGASALGIQALQFIGVSNAREELSALGLPL